MWRYFLNIADAAGYWVGDCVTDYTGYAAIPVSLEQAAHRREVTLPLPGYMQLNSYSCGAITAAMIVRYFRPRMSFTRIYAAVDPDPEAGVGEIQVIQALRSCGLRVGVRNGLRFTDLRRAIDENRPVMVHIMEKGADCGHWVAVYGYSVRPDRVFMAINGRPWCTPYRTSRRKFERMWTPPGNGLICSNKGRPIRLTRPSR